MNLLSAKTVINESQTMEKGKHPGAKYLWLPVSRGSHSRAVLEGRPGLDLDFPGSAEYSFCSEYLRARPRVDNILEFVSNLSSTATNMVCDKGLAKIY